jgi:hypothetical protein
MRINIFEINNLIFFYLIIKIMSVFQKVNHIIIEKRIVQSILKNPLKKLKRKKINMLKKK